MDESPQQFKRWMISLTWWQSAEKFLSQSECIIMINKQSVDVKKRVKQRFEWMKKRGK